MSSAVNIEHIVAGLENITLQCVERLESISYEELQQFLLSREQLILKISNTEITVEQKRALHERVANVLKHDKQILSKMNSFKESAGQEIAKLNAARMRKEAYQSSYQDSYFFDKKK